MASIIETENLSKRAVWNTWRSGKQKREKREGGEKEMLCEGRGRGRREEKRKMAVEIDRQNKREKTGDQRININRDKSENNKHMYKKNKYFKHNNQTYLENNDMFYNKTGTTIHIAIIADRNISRIRARGAHLKCEHFKRTDTRAWWKISNVSISRGPPPEPSGKSQM